MEKNTTCLSDGIMLLPSEDKQRAILDSMITINGHLTRLVISEECNRLSNGRGLIDHVEMYTRMKKNIKKMITGENDIDDYCYNTVFSQKFILDKIIAEGIRQCNTIIQDVRHPTDDEVHTLKNLACSSDNFQWIEIDPMKLEIRHATLYMYGFRHGHPDYPRYVATTESPGIPINTIEYDGYTGIYAFRDSYQIVYRITPDGDNFKLETFRRNYTDEYLYTPIDKLGIVVSGDSLAASNGTVVPIRYSRKVSSSHLYDMQLTDEEMEQYSLIIHRFGANSTREYHIRSIRDGLKSLLYFNPKSVYVEFSSDMSESDLAFLPGSIHSKMRNSIQVMPILYRLCRQFNVSFIMADQHYIYKDICCRCGEPLTPTIRPKRSCMNCRARFDKRVNAAINLANMEDDDIFHGRLKIYK